ncbi:MAG: PAS domain S-box protein [Burkholderiales bacterium]|nr:PAS domain S-box protein [Burkholderiales bacterium]
MLPLPPAELPQSVAAVPVDQRYRLLVDAVTDYAIYMLDTDGIVTSWNTGAERFKGYAAHEIIGRHFSEFYTPQDRASGLPARALAQAATKQFETEGWRVRKDGTRFWAHVVIDPIRGSDGRVIGYAKVTRDLTERRAAEAALRRSQEQFRLLVQGVIDYAIYLIDLDGHVVSWNAGAQRIKGYEPAEIIGRHFETFYREEDRQRGEPARAMRLALENGKFESEGWRIRKDGSSFWASVVLDPVRDDDGQPIGFAKITRDVTEKMAAQRELDAARESLFQSQKLEAIGQLTGGVAHDFNNVLMVILSSLQLIERKLDANDLLTAKVVQNALNATRRGASLTQRMLAFARRQDLKPEPTDLVELVQGMLDLLQRTLGPANIIALDLPPGLPLALVDQNQLELALLNLAVNARDAMQDGGRITVALAEAELLGATAKLPPGRYLKLSVIDTGPGMDAATLARATEPFFTTKGVGKGTGLGLSMVDGLASQSGGQFLLRSSVGQGTEAELWLPAASVAPNAAAVTEPPPAAAASGLPRSLHILLVDDDPLVLDSTAAVLADLGHRVTPAGKALDALARLRTGGDYDLVITDQAMPGMTGTELLAVVKSTRPTLATIVATGYAEMESSTPLPPAVIKLAKPFGQHDLALAIEAALDATQPA